MVQYNVLILENIRGHSFVKRNPIISGLRVIQLLQMSLRKSEGVYEIVFVRIKIL